MFKYKTELNSGIYYGQLLPRGFIKVEDQEPNIDGLDFYLDAFSELSSCRPGGLDVQAIPFTAIVEYSTIYDIDDFDEFAYLMRAMDNLYLKLSREENAKRGNDGGHTNADAKNHNQR